ncbi:CD2-associated protein,SH3 domain-containing kinase-binding protein 1 [Mytilus coruscus]|uniref:CD2-associated protein,SH3 domain-containing kinase-binding protein 1 n=1 Tax=Mytilus coruscus TaxID=42192 RepID=A0A6J8D4C7_MYTCO|nr:CD2-associated protein,SH3 domain-containing kinase-binding protein 1 [Mytilus coruscus]
MVECIVEYDYEAEQPDELSIKAGQIIKNVLIEDGGWWEGELDGKKGMFPDNFVKVIEKKDKPVEKREGPKKDLKTQQRTSVRDLASKIKDGIPVGGSQKKKESHQAVIKRAKVLFSYEPDNEDELKLDIDDVVDVFKQEEEGWWEGSLHGKVGVFPSIDL